MEKQPYTDNPTLDRFLTEMVGGIHDIKNTLESHTGVHNNIMDAVGKSNNKLDYTNGKVGELIKWRERINGGMAVAGVFMSIIVIPILAWSVYSLVRLPQTIQESIQEALVVYEIP